jgi:hypothetical protein
VYRLCLSRRARHTSASWRELTSLTSDAAPRAAEPRLALDLMKIVTWNVNGIRARKDEVAALV